MRVRATAHPNIALVKYWGKRDEALNLPTHGSLSVTLGGLFTEVEVAAAPGATDRVEIEGMTAGDAEHARISRFLDRVRALAGVSTPLSVRTRSNFPMAAGLASSASSFAALALASSRAVGLTLPLEQVSGLARQGSGSAARSLHGGFVEWLRGVEPGGSDSIAVSRLPAEGWDLRVLVAVISSAPKAISSRKGMGLTVATSPLFAAWVDTVERDLELARAALHARDLPALGAVAEASCLKMVSTMLTTVPTLHYWGPETLGTVQALQAWRAGGLPVWFTTDAGPNVKALCSPENVGEVMSRLQALPWVQRVIDCPVGGPATVEVLP